MVDARDSTRRRVESNRAALATGWYLAGHRRCCSLWVWAIPARSPLIPPRPTPLALGLPPFAGRRGAAAVALAPTAASRISKRFLRRHVCGRRQALTLGGVAETFVARNRGPRVQAMEIWWGWPVLLCGRAWAAGWKVCAAECEAAVRG